MLISLIGMPGGGKSTVGRQLARRLGVGFNDSDALIERRIGCSIREFFDTEGEERFRDVEQQVIADLVKAGHALAYLPDFALAEHRLVRLQARDYPFATVEHARVVWNTARAGGWVAALAHGLADAVVSSAI